MAESAAAGIQKNSIHDLQVMMVAVVVEITGEDEAVIEVISEVTGVTFEVTEVTEVTVATVATEVTSEESIAVGEVDTEEASRVIAVPTEADTAVVGEDSVVGIVEADMVGSGTEAALAAMELDLLADLLRTSRRAHQPVHLAVMEAIRIIIAAALTIFLSAHPADLLLQSQKTLNCGVVTMIALTDGSMMTEVVIIIVIGTGSMMGVIEMENGEAVTVETMMMVGGGASTMIAVLNGGGIDKALKGLQYAGGRASYLCNQASVKIATFCEYH